MKHHCRYGVLPGIFKKPGAAQSFTIGKELYLDEIKLNDVNFDVLTTNNLLFHKFNPLKKRKLVKTANTKTVFRISVSKFFNWIYIFASEIIKRNHCM